MNKYMIITIIIIICSIVILIFFGDWDFSVNIIDLLMLFATIVLAFVVAYLNKSLNKKNIARDIITEDLMTLCKIYDEQKQLIDRLYKGEISKEDALSEIRMVFHRGDVFAGMINNELKTSFPNFFKSENVLLEITGKYWKWLTDGEMQDKDFKISSRFIKEHETCLINMISELRCVIHQLIKKV